MTATVTPGLVAMLLLGEGAEPIRFALIGLAMLTVWLLVSQRRDDRAVTVVTSPLPVVTSSMTIVGPDTVLPQAPRTRPGAGPRPWLCAQGWAMPWSWWGWPRFRGIVHPGLLAWAAASFLVMLGLVAVRRGVRVLPRGRGGGAGGARRRVQRGGHAAVPPQLLGGGAGDDLSDGRRLPGGADPAGGGAAGERPTRRGWAGLVGAAAVVAAGALSTAL
ncbi:hypothetical protein [Nesterenkonia sp. NBAIMH1]|uniref:hypothetical protein n=1 Tax=Nesterenkonia sp. NBAIMH1 TaxID=2600320 RepID=UPI0011B5E10F|nr:hypothetical protein [Nesterenkonia sp. NBAIMH1]